MTESLSDLQLFVAVAEGAHLAQAATSLGITPAGASAALKRLETQLGVTLVIRSTRRLRLSQDGERYLPHARQVLAALRAGRDAIAADDAELSGWLRIAAPADLGRNALLQRLRAFAERHPQVRFQLVLDDAVSDFYSMPIDLALRYGQLEDSRLIALPLAQLQRVACAAPDYLARHGAPSHPDQLREHATICFMLQQRAATRWRFLQGAHSHEVEVRPRWVFNDAEVVRRCAIQGMGIAYRIHSDVQDDLAAGRLQALLPDWQGDRVALSLVYPDRQLSPLQRAVVKFLSAEPLALGAAAGEPR